MITNEKIITINRPLEEVFAYVGDLQNGPKWQKALVEAWRLDAGPLDIGSKFSSARKFMGRKMSSVTQFTAFKLNKKIVFKSISGSLPFKQTFLFEPADGGTRHHHAARSADVRIDGSGTTDDRFRPEVRSG